MRTGFLHTLLLIALLALTGQALAASCGIDTDSTLTTAAAMTADNGHCAPAHHQDNRCDSDSVAQGCHCCPGHCSGALAADESFVVAPQRSGNATTYLRFVSSPEPDSALRPPIRA
ncbi:hypothetical protein [Microbulbifer sp. SAOS-129_SWC]|uniref:hypothetical protein n=1 Tax=Microbulbifer sp. SAOS-129_SWC TaxID=3145235 RepID=UPI0032166C59